MAGESEKKPIGSPQHRSCREFLLVHKLPENLVELIVEIPPESATNSAGLERSIIARWGKLERQYPFPGHSVMLVHSLGNEPRARSSIWNGSEQARVERLRIASS